MKKIILLIILITGWNFEKEERICNKELLNLFNLKGRVNPKNNTFVDMCGKNMDTCCTIIDELKIMKMWKEHSLNHIRFKTKELLTSYRSIFTLHDMFVSLSPDAVPVHFPMERWVPYMYRTCSKVFIAQPDNDGVDIIKQDNDVVYKLDDTKKPRKLTRQKNSRPNVKGKKALRFFGGLKKIGKIWKSFKEQNLREKKERKLNLNNEKVEIKLNNDEKSALDSVNYIKFKFDNTIQAAIQKFNDFYQGHNNVEKIKADLEKKKSYIENILLMAEKNPGVLKNRALEMDKKIPSKDTFNLKLLNDLVGGSTKIEDVKNSLETRKNEIVELLSEVNDYNNYRLEKEKKFLMEHLNVPINNGFMGSLIKKINKDVIPGLNDSLPFYPLRVRPAPVFNNIIAPSFDCKTDMRSLYRKFYIFNETKYRYCDKVYGNIKKFNMSHFEEYIENIRDSILRINYLKKSIYCSVCDINDQKYINLSKEKFYIKKSFCSSFINEFKTYLEWKNIIFVEYIYNLLQYVKCHQAKASSIEFPYATGIETLYKKIYFFRRCFDNLGQSNEFTYCHFICKEFRYEKITELIEGDIHFLKDMFYRLVAFLRGLNVSIVTNFQKEMLKMTSKFMNIPEEHFDPETGQDIENEIIKEENAIVAQERFLKKKMNQIKRSTSDTILSLKKQKLPERDLTKNNKIEISEPAQQNSQTPVEPKVEATLEDIPETEEALVNREGRILENTPFYEISDPLPVISEFDFVFLEGNQGLSPFETDEMIKMSFEVEDYMERYKKHNLNEAIYPSVLLLVVFPQEVTENFNQDIDLEFARKPFESGAQTFQTQENSSKLEMKINASAMKIAKEKEKSDNKGKKDGGHSDGVPELDYLFN